MKFLKYLVSGIKCEDCGQQISRHDWMIHQAIISMKKDRKASFGNGPKE